MRLLTFFWVGVLSKRGGVGGNGGVDQEVMGRLVAEGGRNDGCRLGLMVRIELKGVG